MCTICSLTIEFAVEHRETLSVAVATRQAMEAGLLPENASDMDMARSRHQATVLLTTMQQRLEQVLPSSRLMALPTFFVLMIESRTWGYFQPTLAGFDPRATPSAPRLEPDENGTQDCVVVISQVAAGEVTGGRLPFARALDKGVAYVDAPLPRHAAVQAAFAVAYPLDQFSEFVCAEVA
ncbi:hypothetical protein ACC713_00165 [Rhizobium johnstonii]|uniref:hypothetical protein n=1 Tax=Rhizobium johnstonii TaxID=3019933 RepID=UPI003F9A7738